MQSGQAWTGARRRLTSATLATVIVASVAVAPAASAGSPRGPQAATAATAATTVSSVKGKLGRFLVNSSGRALYMFTRDPNGKSMCLGSCTQAWKPLLATAATARSGSGVNVHLLGVIKRTDGGTQVTYDHHALYTYSGDTSSKTTAGEGATADGGRWYLLSTAGEELKPKSSGPCNPVCSGY